MVLNEGDGCDGQSGQRAGNALGVSWCDGLLFLNNFNGYWSNDSLSCSIGRKIYLSSASRRNCFVNNKRSMYEANRVCENGNTGGWLPGRSWLHECL